MKKVTLPEVSEWIVEQVFAADIPGLGRRNHDITKEKEVRGRYKEEMLARGNSFGMLHFSWEHCWGIGCGLQVSFNQTEKTVIIGGKKKKTKVSEVTFEVTWGSTGHTPSETIIAADIYTRVAKLALFMETRLKELCVETRDEQHNRESNVRALQVASELKAAQTFEIGKHNVVKDIPWEMHSHLMDEDGIYHCRGRKADGEMCNGKAKNLVWYKANGVFLVRCGRHLDQVIENDLDQPKALNKSSGKAATA